jgi:hypothetical protein
MGVGKIKNQSSEHDFLFSIWDKIEPHDKKILEAIGIKKEGVKED